MNLHDKINGYLARLYIPKSKGEQFHKMRDFLERMVIRLPNANDAHKSRLTILIIETTGKGSRETYQGFRIMYVDFDSIGERYALAYVYDSEGNGKPKRLDITSPKNIILD